jgi:hypothetical protein
MVVVIFFPIASVFGRFFDLLTKRIITDQNPARWSWAFSALPVAVYLRATQRIQKVFATGGALSGQLLGSLIFFRGTSRLFLEFQDPIVGNEIVRSQRNQQLMQIVEEFLIKRSYKSYFVTRRAAISAASRNAKIAEKISFLYPSAWNYHPKSPRGHGEKKSITIMHVGTLYGSRNLDNLFMALDNLKQISEWCEKEITIINLGALYLENSEAYVNREDFQQIFEVDRLEALQIASSSDALLLIQHTDNRSLETIPYKTYDYLNLGLPILGLTNNVELEEIIIQANGVIANANSVSSIQNGLTALISKIGMPDSTCEREKLDISNQFTKLLEIRFDAPEKQKVE